MNQLQIIEQDGVYFYQRQSDPTKMKQLTAVHPVHLINAIKKAICELAIVPDPAQYTTWEEAINSLDNGIQLTDYFDHLEQTDVIPAGHRHDIQLVWVSHISEGRPVMENLTNGTESS